MDMAIARPRFSFGLVELLLALLIAVAFGIAAGYTARAVTSPQRPAVPVSAPACPLGSHPAVWYSARSWACVSD